MKSEFRKWLDSRGLSLWDFAHGSGISYATCARLAADAKRRPRRGTALIVKEKYPDCPLAAGV